MKYLPRIAGREIDAIISFPSGRWAGFEVKLGASADTGPGNCPHIACIAARAISARVSSGYGAKVGPT